jgi:hypothetical protein
MSVGTSRSRYNLLTSENAAVNPYAQSPEHARVLSNFLPSQSGELKRKPYAPPFINSEISIGGQPYWLSHIKDYVFYPGGNRERQIICTYSNNSGTFLYKFVSGGTVTALPAGATSPPHNPTAGWVGDPAIHYSDGLLYISDGQPGSNGTVYDGEDTWKWGLDIPTAPSFVEANAGSVLIDVFREYVITEYDSVHKRESVPSLRLRFVPDTPGEWDVTIQLPALVNTDTGWTSGAADKFRIYASAADGSTELFFISEEDASGTPANFIDTIPFFETLNTAMRPKRPPFRNQKKRPSTVVAKFHNRFIARDEARRSRAWVSGYREIIEQQGGTTGNPLEMFPGARNDDLFALDPDRGPENFSDYENFVELPDDSAEMRAFLWWQDGLMIGTEESVTVLWGRNPEEWRINNSSTYGFGVFSKNSFIVTPHGLVIFTADRKLMLDPVSAPSSGDRTSQVIDIGWVIQPELNKTDARFTNRFQMQHWKFGSERDYLAVAFTTQTALPSGDRGVLKLYDFQIPGWISVTDVEPTAIGTVKEDQGYHFFVAGNSRLDRKVRVVLDYTADSQTPYAAAASRVGLPSAGTVTHPTNVFRTALLDLESPDYWKVLRWLSWYVNGTFTLAVRLWLDPEDDPEDLQDGDAYLLSASQLLTREFRAWVHHRAKRFVIQFKINAGGGEGSLRGLEINARQSTNAGL